LDDPAMAELMADLPEPEGIDMSMAGFDPVRALLTALLDAINQNTAATIAAAGADPPEFLPAPRPVTGVDKARIRSRVKGRQALADLALGRTPSDST
jgi:hypothetical protein